MAWYGLTGSKYQLDSSPLSSGGEGDIFVVTTTSGQVAKVYHADTITRSPELEKKLTVMVKRPPSNTVLSQVAWPLDVLYDSNHIFCGFVMPKLNITDELLELYKYPAQKHKNITIKQKLIVAENICAVISEVHKAGYVFGDFNPRNIGVNMNNGTVAFLDTDSYHILDRTTGAQYKCKVCLDGYVAPETITACKKYTGKDIYAQASFIETFSEETDNFALAIHIFKLLMNGYTPFNGIKETDSASQASPGVGNAAIERNNYCFKPGNKPQSPAVPPKDALPQEIIGLFTRAFITGRVNPKDRPMSIEWHSALIKYENNLISCVKNSTHLYLKSLTYCPWCDADNQYSHATSSPIFQKHFSPSPVVAPPPPAYQPTGNPIAHVSPANRSKTSKIAKPKLPIAWVLLLGLVSSAAFCFSILNSKFMQFVFNMLNNRQMGISAESFLLMLLKMCIPIFIFLPVLFIGMVVFKKKMDFEKSPLSQKLIKGMPFVWLLCFQGSFIWDAFKWYPYMSSYLLSDTTAEIVFVAFVIIPVLFLIPVAIFAVSYQMVLSIFKIKKTDTIRGIISLYASNILGIYLVILIVSAGAYACGWAFSELSGKYYYYYIFAVHALLSLILLGINLIYHGLSQSKNRIIAELGSTYLLSVLGSVLIGFLVLGIEWLITGALNSSQLNGRMPATQNMNLYQLALFASFVILFCRTIYIKVRVKP